MNQKLQVIVCYVGFGDCIHITLPDGCQLLIDTGRIKNFNNIKSFLEKRNKKVDYILITHNHSDHINALPKFSEHFSLKGIIWWIESNAKSSPSDLKIGTEIFNKLIRRKIATYSIHDAKKYIKSFYNFIDILYPIDEFTDIIGENANRNSIILNVKFGERNFLFTGDATSREEFKIINFSKIDFKKTIFLKIGHHGSKSSTSEELLKNLDPQIVKGIACSCSEKRLREPPSEITLEKVRSRFTCFKCTGKSNGFKRHLIFTAELVGGKLISKWETENV